MELCQGGEGGEVTGICEWEQKSVPKKGPRAFSKIRVLTSFSRQSNKLEKIRTIVVHFDSGHLQPKTLIFTFRAPVE